MVDNFALIEEYMKKQQATWKEGDCYYVQLLRRQADDPMIGGVKDKKYHGNMHSRSIKDYLIKSVDHLEDVKQQIIEFCKLENVRAYIRLNKRNYKNIALEMMKHIAEQCASGETFSSPFHLISSACGQCCQAGKDKTWIIDLDKEYLPYEKEIIDMICQCMPISAKIQEIYDSTNAEIHSTGNPCGVSMDEIKQVKSGKLAGFTGEQSNPNIQQGRGDMFPASLETALHILQNDSKGFFLMVGDMYVDRASHNGRIELLCDETIDLDRAVGKVLDFAEKDGQTLVLVVGSPEASGMSLVGGNMAEGTVEAKWSMPGMANHSGTQVPMFAYGPGAEDFGGVWENTELFTKMRKLLSV